MNATGSDRIYARIEEELKALDDKEVEVGEGVCLKPSQCYHYSFHPLHLLFNTNCPQAVREKVEQIFEKYLPSGQQKTG